MRRAIEVRFAGVCKGCGGPINSGDRIVALKGGYKWW